MVFLRRVEAPVIGLALSLVLACAVTAPAAFAAAGDLDASFGSGGVAFTPALPDLSGGFAYDLLVQPDGKLTLAGHLGFSSGPHDLAAQRFNADGTIDTTFGGDGVVVTPVSGASGNFGMGIARQSDGKLVLLGKIWNISDKNEFALVRYLADGTLDDGFDGDSGLGNGVVRATVGTEVPLPSDAPAEMIIDSGGKIVVVGESGTSDGNVRIAVARFNADGTLDTTFSGDGKAIFDTSASVDRGLAIAEHPLGGYVVAGRAKRGSGPTTGTFALYRVASSGLLDPTFTGDAANTSALAGTVITTIGGQATDFSNADAVAVQTDGKILAAGYTYNNGSAAPAPVVVRYLANGAFDPSFGVNGRAMFGFGGASGTISDMLLDPAGRILVTGLNDTGAGQYGAAARLTSDGVLDASFGVGGVMTMASTGFAGQGFAIALQADGKSVIAGSGPNAMMAARLLGDPPAAPASPSAPVLPLPDPFAKITSPAKSVVARRRLKRFAGTAGPAGNVATVEIALQRVDRRLLKKRGRCVWLRNAKARFKLVKAVRRKCSRPRFLRARGEANWSFRLRRTLPTGRYRLLVRTTLNDGRRHTSFSASNENLLSFRIR